MDLKILSCWQAKKFEPTVKTVAMRIYSRNPFENVDYGDLRESGLYVAKFKYVFDDIANMTGEEIDRASKLGIDENPDLSFMSREIAEQIVNDFVSVRNGLDCLMVHCKMGEGRSAAVGIALNEVFSLGDSTFRMSQEFPNFNEGVYELVRDAGKKL